MYFRIYLAALILVSTASAELPTGSLKVPLVRQATEYSCGAASLVAALRFWKVYDGSESDLHGPLGTGPDGTAPESIAEEARAFGLEAELREGQNIDSLRQAFLDGATVILDLQAWRSDTTIPWAENWDDGHYVVLVGIDDKQLYVMDPLVATGYAYLPVEELMERWHDVEERDGVVRRYYQAGIFIKGREKLVSFPEAPIRLE